MASKLSLETAARVCANVVSLCKAKGFAPICVVVCDANGVELCRMKMDGCPPIAYPRYALAKATTAVSFGMSSRRFRDKYISSPDKIVQLQSMISSLEGKICAFPGSVLLSYENGDIAGAVGVSGASSDQDEYLALQAVRNADCKEMTTEPSSSPLD